MSYEVMWEPRGDIKRFWGTVSSQDMIRSVIETQADARFDRLRYVINDFLAVALGASRTNPAIKIAIVATLAELVEFGRQYADSDLNVYPTKIFATMAAARAWTAEPLGFRATRW